MPPELFDTPLMVEAGALTSIVRAFHDQVRADDSEDSPTVQDVLECPDLMKQAEQNGIQVINISGPLINRGGFMETLCGMTSYSALSQQVSEALANPEVEQIVFRGEEFGDLGPVHDIPPRGDVVRPAILVLQIVGVLPHVESQDRRLSFH